MGPVQVLVVGFEHAQLSGEILDEFARLQHAGIVRLLDVLLVERGADGQFDTLAAPVQLGSESGALAAALLARADGASTSEPALAHNDSGDEHTWSLADAVPTGSVAAVALIEHTWATPLVAAMHRAGGRLLDETWLPAEDVAVLEQLIAQGSRAKP
jgi:uncharacterized membrane protein